MNVSTLPDVGPGADLATVRLPKRWLAFCFGLTFLVYVALIPRFVLYSSPPTGDQPFYLMDTISIAQDGDLNVRNNYLQHDEDKFYGLAPHPVGFVGISAPYPLPAQTTHAAARPPSEWYGYHLPGLGVLLVPAWIIGSWFALWWPATIAMMCLVGALVALNIFLLAFEQTGRLWIACAVWLPLAFSNPLMSYSYMLFTELPTGLLVIYAFRRLTLGWAANGRWRLLLVGACIGYIPWLAWRCVLIALPLALLAAIQWWRYARLRRQLAGGAGEAGGGVMTWYGSPEVRDGALLALPLLISAVLLVRYNLFLFGQILPSMTVPELGDQSPFMWPWKGAAEFTHFVTTGFAFLFDRQMGLLTYTPIYLLVVVGMIAMMRSQRQADRRLLLKIGLCLLPYTALLMTFIFWNGIWCPPARYPTTLVPLLAAPLAMSLSVLAKSWAYRALYVFMALPGFVFMAIMMYDARMMWPTSPIWGWLAGAPESPVHVNLSTALPAFSPLDDLRLPVNTGWTTAISVMIIGLCYLMMRRLKVPRSRISRGIPVGLVLGWPAALVVVGSGWYVMNRDYLKPPILITQKHRWTLTPSPIEPRGLTYLNGRIFIADFKGKTIGQLNTQTGAYTLLHPVGAQGVLTYTNPGDITIGPQGLLYVLNNGPDRQAAYVMTPAGRVVKQLALDGKTPIAIGLSFAPSGDIYVSDMVGGRVIKYGPEGGKARATVGGVNGGFNNPVGLTIDKDGTIYAADAVRIQQLDVRGGFIRKWDLQCHPMYMALHGDWLYSSCDAILIGINTRTGDVQKVRQVDGDPLLQAPAGLAYAPDGALYVLDGNSVAAFTVHH